MEASEEGRSNTAEVAQLLQEELQKKSSLSADAPEFIPKKVAMVNPDQNNTQLQKKSSLSADAPEFIPKKVAMVNPDQNNTQKKSSLSADAPEFIPKKVATVNPDQNNTQQNQTNSKNVGPISEGIYLVPPNSNAPRLAPSDVGSDIDVNRQDNDMYGVKLMTWDKGSLCHSSKSTGEAYQNRREIMSDGDHTKEVNNESQDAVGQFIDMRNKAPLNVKAVGKQKSATGKNAVHRTNVCQIPSRPEITIITHPVSKQANRLPILYSPHGKIAILIGNWNYANLDTLDTPKNEIEILGEIFRDIGFTVVSLVNLTKDETINVVKSLTNKYIHNKSYAVFYCAAHGFEENGMIYLLPVDSPREFTVDDGVCLNDIHEIINRNRPMLIAIIVDVCRERIHHIFDDSTVPRAPYPPYPSEVLNDNTIWVFSTNKGGKTFESGQIDYFCQVVCKLLKQTIGIEALFSAIKKEFKTRPQKPEIRSHLSEPDMSLTDPVDPDSRQDQIRQYNELCDLPKPKNFEIENVGVNGEIRLNFDVESDANVLVVTVEMNPKWNVERYNCNTDIKFIAEGKEISQPDNQIIENEEMYFFEYIYTLLMEDIQKYKELTLQVTVSFFDGCNLSHREEILINPIGETGELWDMGHSGTSSIVDTFGSLITIPISHKKHIIMPISHIL